MAGPYPSGTTVFPGRGTPGSGRSLVQDLKVNIQNQLDVCCGGPADQGPVGSFVLGLRANFQDQADACDEVADGPGSLLAGVKGNLQDQIDLC